MTNLQVASEELEDLKTMFFKLDKDKSGVISRAELETGLTEVIGKFAAERIDFDEMMDAVDTNKDGMIDFSEWISASFNR